jgi:hypothetical protein
MTLINATIEATAKIIRLMNSLSTIKVMVVFGGSTIISKISIVIINSSLS